MPWRVVPRGELASNPPDANRSNSSNSHAATEQAARGEQTTATVPAKFRGHARRDAAAFYLSQLAKGVLSGEVAIAAGERHVTLATAEFLFMEIEVEQKKRANHICIKLRWPKRPLIRTAMTGGSRNGG
jgi:amphi-Trp domain-containing protein